MLRQTFSALLAFLLLYFLSHKTWFFPFQNNPKYLKPYCKMDLDLWNCFGRKKKQLIGELHRAD